MYFAKKNDLKAGTNRTLSTISSHNESQLALASLKIHDVFSYNVLITVKINVMSITFSAGTGSAMDFVSACCAENLGLPVAPASKVVRMANSSKSSKVIDIIKIIITLHNQTINDVCLYVQKPLVGDLIVGNDLPEHFKTVCFLFDGDRLALRLESSISRASSVYSIQ